MEEDGRALVCYKRVHEEDPAYQQGDLFGTESRIAGYECDGCEFILKDGLPVPTGRDGTPRNLVILLHVNQYPTGKL